jgi:hypothetical protein
MVTMVAGILSLMYNGFHLLILSPFPPLLPLLGRFLVIFFLATAWMTCLVAYVFQILCMYICLVHFPWLENNHLIS